jgi:hypothetical protein
MESLEPRLALSADFHSAIGPAWFAPIPASSPFPAIIEKAEAGVASLVSSLAANFATTMEIPLEPTVLAASTDPRPVILGPNAASGSISSTGGQFGFSIFGAAGDQNSRQALIDGGTSPAIPLSGPFELTPDIRVASLAGGSIDSGGSPHVDGSPFGLNVGPLGSTFDGFPVPLELRGADGQNPPDPLDTQPEQDDPFGNPMIPLILWTRLPSMHADDLSGDIADESILGSLASIDADQNSLDLDGGDSSFERDAEPGWSGRAVARSSPPELPLDSTGNAWISYVANADSIERSTPIVASSADVVDQGDSRPDGDDAHTGSIVGGNLPLSVLLGAAEAPVPGQSSELAQVAELVPVDRSSLAIIGTLWSVYSDVSESANRGSRIQADESSKTDRVSDPTAPWVAFVTGLSDESGRAIRPAGESRILEIMAEDEIIDSANTGRDRDEPLWDGPILPAGSFPIPGGPVTSDSRVDDDLRGSATLEANLESTRRVENDAGVPADQSSDVGPAIVRSSLPGLTIVVAFGAIARRIATLKRRRGGGSLATTTPGKRGSD